MFKGGTTTSLLAIDGRQQIDPDMVGRFVRRVLYGDNHTSPSRVHGHGQAPIGVAKVQTSGRSLKHGITCDCSRRGLDLGQQANVQAGSRPIPVAVGALD